jgi:hypothetical protein
VWIPALFTDGYRYTKKTSTSAAQYQVIEAEAATWTG